MLVQNGQQPIHNQRWVAGDRGTKSKPVPDAHLVYGLLTTTPNAVVARRRKGRQSRVKFATNRTLRRARLAKFTSLGTELLAYFSGSTTVLVDPSGAACIPGGLWPCGLSAGAPPEDVLIGPVQPCGCNWPLSSGGVRPVLEFKEFFPFV
jgi:hypothetical protein